MLTPFRRILEIINKSVEIVVDLPIYCLCRMPEMNKSYFGYPCVFMIECSNCLEWFHKSGKNKFQIYISCMKSRIIFVPVNVNL